MTDPRLWERIRIAPLPMSNTHHEFCEALAYAVDLPVFEEREVVEEYRRFLYLATITDAPLVPPEPVRQAWAMHAQSPEYAAFCAGVGCRPLGLPDARRKLDRSPDYQRARAAYAREFSQTPPAAIWPPAPTRRLPRWLPLHGAVLGFTGMAAWGSGEILMFATGVGVSLAVYGLDVYGAHLSRERQGLGVDLSNDLAFFLSEAGKR
ncbi:MAG TPA: hypothetical protein ENK80_00430 [Rhodobacterales bacterium]|nr:hypothetical protein [Rhodobacterales bacterium]